MGIGGSFDCKRILDDACVVNNTICFPKQTDMNLLKLFHTRYELHKRVYTHKVVIAVQCMMAEIMSLVDRSMRLQDCLLDTNLLSFCRLNEQYILNVIKYKVEEEGTDDKGFIEAAKILDRVHRRDFYAFLAGKTMGKRWKLTEERKMYLSELETRYHGRILVHQSKIGYVSGDKDNPLDHIYFYNRKNLIDRVPIKMEKIAKEKVSRLISDTYQEHYIMFFWTGN